MLFENVDRFEEIPEVYGVFPLRDDFLEAGNRALEKYGVKEEVEDNVIRIPFADRLLFDGADGENAGKDWRMEITACISLNRHPEDGSGRSGVSTMSWFRRKRIAGRIMICTMNPA